MHARASSVGLLDQCNHNPERSFWITTLEKRKTEQFSKLARDEQRYHQFITLILENRALFAPIALANKNQGCGPVRLGKSALGIERVLLSRAEVVRPRAVAVYPFETPRYLSSCEAYSSSVRHLFVITVNLLPGVMKPTAAIAYSQDRIARQRLSPFESVSLFEYLTGYPLITCESVPSSQTHALTGNLACFVPPVTGISRYSRPVMCHWQALQRLACAIQIERERFIVESVN